MHLSKMSKLFLPQLEVTTEFNAQTNVRYIPNWNLLERLGVLGMSSKITMFGMQELTRRAKPW